MSSSKQRAASMPATSAAIKTYENVCLQNGSKQKQSSGQGIRGSLRILPRSLLFESDDGSKKIKLQWDQLEKSMISPSNSDKTLLKVVSKKQTSKILELPNRSSLLQVREDIHAQKRKLLKLRKTQSSDGQLSSLAKPTLRQTKSEGMPRHSAPLLGTKAIIEEDDSELGHSEEMDESLRLQDMGDESNKKDTKKKTSKNGSSSELRNGSEDPNNKLHNSLSAISEHNHHSSKKRKSNRRNKLRKTQSEAIRTSKGKPEFDWVKHGESLSQLDTTDVAVVSASKEETNTTETTTSEPKKEAELVVEEKKSNAEASKQETPITTETNTEDDPSEVELSEASERSSTMDDSSSKHNKKKKKKRKSKNKDKKEHAKVEQSAAAKEEATSTTDSDTRTAETEGTDESSESEEKKAEEEEASEATSKAAVVVATPPPEEDSSKDDEPDNTEQAPETSSKEAEESSPPETDDNYLAEMDPAEIEAQIQQRCAKNSTTEDIPQSEETWRLSDTSFGKTDEDPEPRTSELSMDEDEIERQILKTLGTETASPETTNDEEKEQSTESAAADRSAELRTSDISMDEEEIEEQILKAMGDQAPPATTSDEDAEQKKEIRASVKALQDSLKLSLHSSMQESVMSLSEDDIEAAILKAMGDQAPPPAAAEGDDDAAAAREKALRKSRMSVRMSTRVTAMNNARRTSRLDASMGNSMSRMSTRMSTRMSLAGGRMSTRMSISRRGSGSFVMFKDLEERDEFQKLQAGAFLRELYKLAMEETKQQMKDTLKSMEDGSSKSAAKDGDKDGNISLEGMDLSALTPEQAKTTINALHAGGKIEGESLIKLIKAAVEMMSQEDTVIDLRELHPDLKKVTAVGDLHGSLECIITVMKLADFDNIGSGHVIVFDGDFVDRGHNSLEVIETLLLLKLSHPKSVMLIRGNHEDSMTATSYGFREEVDEKYGYDQGDEIWWEFGYLFAAFPICARSNTAAIMHGGIPVEEFTLDDLNELSKETRCEFKTVSDPYDDDERLVQGILWSDPSEEEGINFSDRGAGFTFGPDITKDFLDRHDLKYIIRAHEVVESGHCHHDVGDGRGVITIFSSANYPAGEGTNSGAVMFLNDVTGEYETKDFIHKENNESQENEALKSFLKNFVSDHKSQLTKAFREKQTDDGFVTTDQWADIIAELLDLPETSLTWLDLQPDVAPATEPDGDQIDWMAFLGLEKDHLAALNEHKDKFLDIFQLMDADGSGTISREEFTSGLKMLNDQIPDDNLKMEGGDKIFDSIDVDGSGEISIEELSKAMQESSALQGVTEAVDDAKMKALKEHQDMISTGFNFLDADKNGGINPDEFQKGFEVLDKRMPERNKFGEHNEWFDLFDTNDKGEIELDAFKEVFCAI